MPDTNVFGLTPPAAELLAFLRAYIGEHGHAPTYEVMKVATGQKSKSGIHRLLTQIESRGYIVWRHRERQTIALTDNQTFRLPAALAARLCADAKLCAQTPEQHLADAVRAYCPAPYGSEPNRSLRETYTSL